MLHRSRPVLGLAGEDPAVLHPHAADVDVRDDVTVESHVLADQVPERRTGKSST